jgi:uncharacterized membrane protein
LQTPGERWVRRVSTKRMSRASLVHPLLLRPDVYVDKCTAIAADPALQFLTVAYYRPGALHFNVVDMALLLYVSLVAIGWGEAESVGAAVGQLILITAGITAVLSALWVVRPQKPEEKYQSVVDAMVLLMAVVQAVLNTLNTAVRLKYGLSGRAGASATAESAVLPPSAAASDPLVAAFQAMCYITVASALTLLAAIVAMFCYVLWHGAHLDELQRMHAQELDIDAVADGKAVLELSDAVGSGLLAPGLPLAAGTSAVDAATSQTGAAAGGTAGRAATAATATTSDANAVP